MMILRESTFIAAPIHRCFDLSRSIDVHMRSTAQTNERAIAGVTSGLIGGGETVTWRGHHFGFRLKHTSRITGYTRPSWFQDSMLRGIFKSFVHNHSFFEQGNGTLVRDELTFAAPLGPLGWIVERLLLGNHLRELIRGRNQIIKQIAETDDWQKYLHE